MTEARVNRWRRASVRLGAWMSAALDDPKVCAEMKADIQEWFSAGEPFEAMADLDRQGHRADCAIRLPHPASICTCHIADKQRAETFASSAERDDDGLCSHCGAPLYPSERCDCWDRLASVGTRPKGGDAHAAPALPSDAVGEAETPTPSPIDPLNVEEGL